MQADRQLSPAAPGRRRPRYSAPMAYSIVFYRPGGVITVIRCREKLEVAKARAELMGPLHNAARIRIIDHDGRLVWHSIS